MFEIKKVYRQTIPATRFIRKKYSDSDRENGSFAHKWQEWFAKGHFATLEKLLPQGAFFEDSGAYIGLMRWKEQEPFEYSIGMFLPKDTEVPEGFDHVDFPESALGVVWLFGKEENLYCHEDACYNTLVQKGEKVVTDSKGALWFFERYVCPRFTNPDDQGNVVLDICYFIK